MICNRNLVTTGWKDYELIDSGDTMKLERFGSIVLVRPEIQALWKRHTPTAWKKVDGIFTFQNNHGTWKQSNNVPEEWECSWNSVRFLTRFTNFKHIGVFPEQAPNWEWLKVHIPAVHGARILNLFGYTGIASIIAAVSGASVTHVDASKQSLNWAHKNAQHSHVADDRIRWILDDTLTFVKREARRHALYDGIILDPPTFGRGIRGEVWKIENDLPKLLEALVPLLAQKSRSFFLLNGYASGYAARSFAQTVESSFGAVEGEYGELYLKESGYERVIPSGIYVRFVR